MTSAQRSISPSNWNSVAVASVEMMSLGSRVISSRYREPNTVKRAARAEGQLKVTNKDAAFHSQSLVILGSTTSISMRSLCVSLQDPPNMLAKYGL